MTYLEHNLDGKPVQLATGKVQNWSKQQPQLQIISEDHEHSARLTHKLDLYFSVATTHERWR